MTDEKLFTDALITKMKIDVALEVGDAILNALKVSSPYDGSLKPILDNYKTLVLDVEKKQCEEECPDVLTDVLESQDVVIFEIECFLTWLEENNYNIVKKS